MDARSSTAAPARLILTSDDVAEGAAWLGRTEPRFAQALARIGPLPLRRREGGFAALLRTICAQQVSVASAESVWAKLEAAGAGDPAVLADLDAAALRACGLSAQKARYARALATAGLDFRSLSELSEEDAITALVAIPGIGRWTAEVYLMMAVGRADVFAAGDLALQEGARMLFELDARPSEAALRARAAAWSPWRTVAANLLWSYYLHLKGRDGI